MPRYAYKPILDTKVKAVKLEPYVVDQNEDTNIDTITESGIHYISGKNVKGLYRPHSLQKLVGQLWVMFNARSACVRSVRNTVVIEYANDDSGECTEINDLCDLIYNIAKDWQSNNDGETVQAKWLLDMSEEDSEDFYAEDEETRTDEEEEEDDVDHEQVKEDLLNDFKETIMNTLNKYGVSHEDIENVEIVKTPYGFGIAVSSGLYFLKKPEVKEEEEEEAKEVEEENEEKDFMDALRALLLTK